MAGSKLHLIGQRDPGPMPTFAEHPDEVAEAAAVAKTIERLIENGTAGVGDRGAVSHQRAVGGLRGGAHRGGHRVPGARRGGFLQPPGDPAGPAGAAARRRARRRRVGRRLPAVGARTARAAGADRRAAVGHQGEGTVGGAGRTGRTRRGGSGAAAFARPARVCSPSCGSAPTPGTHRSCRASPWRRCTRRRVWSGMRCSSSASPTARCPSRTLCRTAPTASRRGGTTAALRRNHQGASAFGAQLGTGPQRPAAGRGGARRASSTASRRNSQADAPGQAATGSAAPTPRCRVCNSALTTPAADHAAPLRDLPVRHRRGAARRPQGVAAAHLQGDERARVCGVHRQHADRDRRDAARPTRPRWSRSPASARASSSSSAPTCSRLVKGRQSS